MATSGARLLGWAAILAAITVAVLTTYWPYLDAFFALDDYIWLKEASNPSAPDYFRRAFSFPEPGYFDPQTPFWRPLIDLYFFAAWRSFHLHAWPYHTVNVLLHVGVATLVAVLVWRLSSSMLAAALGALLFCILPTYSYAVTWISSATELFGTFFYLLTAVLFASYLSGATARRWIYGASIASMLLALLSKESAITLPAAITGIALLIRWPKSLRDLRTLALELLPFAVLTAAYFVFIYSQEYNQAGSQRQYEFGWHVRTNLWDYLKWLVFPVFDTRAGWIGNARPIVVSVFLALGALSIALRNWRAAFAFAWTLVALLPYSFFRLGIEYRYTYLACVPFVVFLTLFVQDIVSRVRPPASGYLALASAVGVVALCGFLATETRDRQLFISTQGDAYHQVYDEVPALCGSLPPEGSVYMIYDPVYDLFDTSVRMTINMRYDRVRVYRGEPNELIDFVPNVCLLDYEDGRFVLVDKH